MVERTPGLTRVIPGNLIPKAFSMHQAGLRLLQEHLGHLNFNTTARYRKIAGEEHRHWYDGLWLNMPC